MSCMVSYVPCTSIVFINDDTVTCVDRTVRRSRILRASVDQLGVEEQPGTHHRLLRLLGPVQIDRDHAAVAELLLEQVRRERLGGLGHEVAEELSEVVRVPHEHDRVRLAVAQLCEQLLG